ncbi:MAG: DUF481 domain-containing protein [Ekhidna sp.]|uniref:DUF481 domain-containing protein n=1 Tax=Ekhidna sp. TaxID=2608089 RepID=UPI0032EAFA0E
MKQLIFFILFIISWASASAQILKVDKDFLATDSSNYFTGVIDATFAINNRSSTAEKQNVYIGANNNVDVVYIAEQSATVLISGLNYFKIGDGPLIYNGTAHLREIFRRAATLTPEVYGQVQFDESRNMELRWLLGGGYRWNILQKQNSLYMGLGLFREYERWNGTEEKIEKELWKLNTYFSADVKLTPTTNVNAIIYFQSGNDSAIDVFRNRVSGQLEFKNALTDQFKIKMTSNFLLDDKPIIPLNKFIYEVYFGVEYAFN